MVSVNNLHLNGSFGIKKNTVKQLKVVHTRTLQSPQNSYSSHLVSFPSLKVSFIKVVSSAFVPRCNALVPFTVST